jgi:twitching motility protein PilI
MSRRRNKNNKGPQAGKGGKQAKPAQPIPSEAPAVVDVPEIPPGMDFPTGDLSAMLASAEMSEETSPDSGEVESGMQDSTALSDGDTQESGDAAAEAFDFDQAPAAHDHASDADAAGESQAMPDDAPEAPVSMHDFEDASAALAQAIEIDPGDATEAARLESIEIPESVPAEPEAAEAAPAWDSMGAAGNDASGDEPPPAAEPQPVGKGRKKLKLNKLQKHARAPEPEPEPVVPEPEPVRIPRAPREPRIPAFAKLTEYQSLSLAHVPGLPEEADVPGHWRGVGFGIGGRRLVTAFDEVVEIMRLPQITHVPGTQTWMLGVANVRGTLLPVVDLKQFLEGERTVMHEGQRVLVVRQAGGNVAVLIDQLFGQRSFNDSQKSDLTSQSGTRYDNFIRQFYRVGDNDWGVFSMSMLTRTPEFRQAAA